ncbi:MAG: hypothetical protein HOO04_00150 [Phycisphaerae bacterium]|jgi:hypothetical protein|nr:hypothetical protein [Phycisphaerae bacterium]
MHGRFAALALTLLSTLFGVGCTMHDGGYMPSAAGTWSPMTFQSTAAVPKTVVIVDTRTGETVFELDIPLGKQLSVQFFKYRTSRRDGPSRKDGGSQYYMKYTVHTLGSTTGGLDESVDLPAAWNRRLDVFMRSPEDYTPMDPTRPVEPLDVPLPEAAAPKPTIVVPVPKPTQPEIPAKELAANEPKPETPGADPPAPVVDPTPAAPEVDAPAQPTETITPTEPAPSESTPTAAPTPAMTVDTTSIPATPLTPATPIDDHANAPLSTMTWTDTGHTRRVWVTDIRTGDRVFEVDVPKGSDLTLHFFDMWTPPSTPDDVQSMHWEIVPAGSTVKVPAHHATVPSGPFRRISEQAVEPPAAREPATAAPASADETLAEPTDSTPPPPPVDLLDDGADDETKTAPKSA